VLIVQGRQDVLGESTPREIHRVLPQSRVEFIERCGHFPWIEQPRALCRIVTNFLDGVE
jgi:proline iminopeptidase